MGPPGGQVKCDGIEAWVVKTKRVNKVENRVFIVQTLQKHGTKNCKVPVHTWRLRFYHRQSLTLCWCKGWCNEWLQTHSLRLCLRHRWYNVKRWWWHRGWRQVWTKHKFTVSSKDQTKQASVLVVNKVRNANLLCRKEPWGDCYF